MSHVVGGGVDVSSAGDEVTAREPLAFLIMAADVVADLAHGAAACWALQRANVLDVAGDAEEASYAAQAASRRLGRAVSVLAVTVADTVCGCCAHYGPCSAGEECRGLLCVTCDPETYDDDEPEPGFHGHREEPDRREPHADDGETSPPESRELAGL